MTGSTSTSTWWVDEPSTLAHALLNPPLTTTNPENTVSHEPVPTTDPRTAPFPVGTVVRLRSGGPPMTVTYSSTDPMNGVSWFDGSTLQQRCFPAEALTLHAEPEVPAAIRSFVGCEGWSRRDDEPEPEPRAFYRDLRYGRWIIRDRSVHDAATSAHHVYRIVIDARERYVWIGVDRHGRGSFRLFKERMMLPGELDSEALAWAEEQVPKPVEDTCRVVMGHECFLGECSACCAARGQPHDPRCPWLASDQAGPTTDAPTTDADDAP